MAKPGDPFETAELDALRSKQRRLLRFVDDWIVDDAAGMLPDLEAGSEADRLLLEHAVRTKAAPWIARSRERLEQMESYTTGDLLRPVLHTWRTVPTLRASPLSKLGQELSSGPRRDEQPRLEDGEYESLVQLALLLLLADELADDYRDPRLGVRHSP